MPEVVEKFLCGCGTVKLYYCKVCGNIYASREEALRCERGHSRSAQDRPRR